MCSYIYIYDVHSMNKVYSTKGVNNKKHCLQMLFFQETNGVGFFHVPDDYHHHFFYSLLCP